MSANGREEVFELIPMMGSVKRGRGRVNLITYPVRPMYMGRSCSVVVTESKVMTPAYRPTPPKPQRARPKMRTSILLAAPQMADPASNRKTDIRYSILASN